MRQQIAARQALRRRRITTAAQLARVRWAAAFETAAHAKRALRCYEHFFIGASHFMWAFSQAALVVGVLSAADAGAVKATASPKATSTETSFFIGVSPSEGVRAETNWR